MQLFNSKKALYYLGLVIFTTTLFFQCRKNEDTLIDQPYQPVYVSGGVYGNAVNEQGTPMQNVKVTHGNSYVNTDENGVFILQNQLLDKAGAQIKFEKPGYYSIYKSVIPIKDKMVSVKTQLVPKTLTSTIIGATGGVIPVNGNAQITIPKESVIDASGNIYAGKVNVFAYWMDPSLEKTFHEMPGNLTGRDKDGKEVVLQTLGMMAVELEDQAGNPLNIATGKFAELKFPIPTALDAFAKSDIPTWSYNAVKGGWIEEGVATRSGNFYVASVSHFSFWNCDYPKPLINIKGRVLDNSGKPVGSVLLEILDENTKQKGYGVTTSDGLFAGKIPANAAFEMKVSAGQCPNAFSKKFTTATSDLDLGDINTTIKSVNLFGYILDCSSNPVTNGYFQAWSGAPNFTFLLPTNTSGRFDGNIAACVNMDLSYKVIDFTNLKQSPVASTNIGGELEINFGNLKACEELTNVISLNANGINTIYINATCDNIGGELRFSGIEDPRDSSYINFILSAIDINKYQNPKFFAVFEPQGTFYFNCIDCTKMNVKITQYGAIGTQIKGVFNGKLVDLISLIEVDVSGEFSVERKR